ncbi:MAG TPA: TonB-dependent receptor [Flavisolibacter sp.]|jgi:outer membrane receptor protein involved in Fe transport|nr:TonB-dependent receptor [Flavisolibacter sp.]
MLKRFLLVLTIIQLASSILYSQVTTSGISGSIRSNTESLIGATVTATHQPTGTRYRTTTLKDGIFNLTNLIPGGPYRLEASFVGFQTFVQDSIVLALGENTRLDIPLSSSSGALQEVVVSGASNVGRKTGASTSIGRQQIAALPTLSRSIQDFTRLTPQANGNSFGGANNRFNNITIDGAVNNDVFGLSGSGTPGGQAGTTPISLDAIQEIQVVLAPYDITYGNFTGGGVNAVTRSGTNKYEGSVYYFLRNQNTIGSDPITKIKSTAFSDKQFGARFGGAIIPNKLFFFVNGEMTRRTAPTLFNAGEDRALITAAEGQRLSDTMRIKYGYDVGNYNAPFDAETRSDKLFGRIDWNISDKHRLTVRHNYISAYDDNISRSTTFFRFGNNAYRFNNKQNITVVELRSRFSNRLSNNLIIGSHRIRDFRSTYGNLFPFIEITHNSGTIQMGSERSSLANELDQDIFEVTDNLKIFRGKHTFTVGTHNEFFKFRNLFIDNLNGRWSYNTLNDFYAGISRQVQVTTSNVAGDPKPSARFDAAQLGFYAQDEIQISPKFRLTAGLRVDMPVIQDKPLFNAKVDSTFKGKYSTSYIPNKQLLWSPRVGFNYDVYGDRSATVRGGVGIFTGRVPFVWISNQFSNNGVLLNTISITGNRPFIANPNNQTAVGGTAARTFQVNLIDQNFKFPQVFRANIATDFRLPGGVLATFEGIYSKTLNNILYQDVNLAAPVGIVDQAYNNGFDKRIAFSSSTNAGGRRINPDITNALLIKNTNAGYSYNLTAQISKNWKNIFASFAYNHNDATEPNSGSSSTALSNWQFTQVVGDPNNPPLATSNYALTHRITSVLAYNINYAKFFKTSVAFFYEGRSGTRLTYLVNGDLNSDGGFGNDLAYIPRNASEIKFIDRLNSNGGVINTAAEQAAAFEAYISNDKYLNSRRGDYTERNGSTTPWEHVIDARLAQDFTFLTGKTRHTLQVTFDVFNFTNLLNSEWGRQYSVGNQAYNLLTTINRTTGPTQFQGKGYNFTIGQVPWSTNFGSRFQGQIGLRYLFN